ncbi:hypothetical protein BGZ98_008551 [Dissophora globulifera]|nr:hypothetical protein BGZ98_008551 [Dissophora globulifera]
MCSLPGRGKNQRQSSSKRSGHDREQQQQQQGRTGEGGRSSSSLSTLTSTADSLAISMGQLSAGGDKARGNNKKNQVSLNHLLNFSFPVREEPQNTGPVRRRRNVNYQPFNKDKFINANFRFLLSPRREYEVYTMDADVSVEWEDIEQVLISVPQSCPICLQPPVAARITKCGHVYCFSCILHYLALSETSKAWRKCPICWDAIYEKDLKSVRTVQEEHDINDQGEKEIAKQIASKQEVILEMRLIQRSLNSTVALPRSKTYPLNGHVLPDELKGQPPLEFYPDAMVFSRLMVTTLDRIISELDRDIRSIEFNMEDAKSYDADAHSEEMVFFEVALDKIRNAKDEIRKNAKFFPKSALDRERILRQYFDRAGTEEPQAAGGAQQGEGEEEDETLSPSVRAISYEETGPEAYEVARQANAASSTLEASAGTESHTASGTEMDSDAVPSSSEAEPAPAPIASRNRPPNQVTTTFFFYQASNGHHLYLQPLDIRILKQHFQTYDKFPDRITVKAELKMRRSKRHEKEVREERERIAREHKLNPPKPRREDIFSNDPFFQIPRPILSSSGIGNGNSRDSAADLGLVVADADLQEALRVSAQAELDEMPTLTEALARSTRRSSELLSGSNTRAIPASGDARATNTSVGGGPEHWTSSYESNASSGHTGPSTVWGTPSVPVSRPYDEYDDLYDDEHDFEHDVVVKRGKKKVTLLMSTSSRRNR